MRGNRFDGRMKNFNDIFSQCCNSTNSTSVHFIPTDTVLGDESGSYTTYLTVNESTIRVRDDDGIHLSSDGGDLIAEIVLNEIKKDFNIKSQGISSKFIDGVDECQKTDMIEVIGDLFSDSENQYIVTMNENQLKEVRRHLPPQKFEDIINRNTILSLTAHSLRDF